MCGLTRMQDHSIAPPSCVSSVCFLHPHLRELCVRLSSPGPCLRGGGGGTRDGSGPRFSGTDANSRGQRGYSGATLLTQLWNVLDSATPPR